MHRKSGRYLLMAGILAIVAMLAVIIAAGRIFSHNRAITVSEQDRYVTVLGSKIRYRVTASGEPAIILLHGYGGSLDGWGETQARLTNNKTITLDLIGFGGSDKPDIAYTLETHRRYLVGFMDQLGIQQAVLVGGSMGGSLAAWTAAKSPERVVSLVLIAPSGLPGSLKKFPPYSWFYRPGLPNRLANIVVSNALFRYLYPESIARQALNVTSTYNADYAAALGEIKQPVLLTWSTGDHTALYEYHKEYLQRIPQAEFKALPASYAHKVLSKDPAGTAEFINNFVAKGR